MQTPKARIRSKPLDSQKSSSATPRTTRVTKGCASESESSSTTNTPARLLVERAKANSDRKSPRSAVTEKKRPSRVTELELKLSQLQEELKKSREELNASESLKKKAEQEVEEGKQQLLSLTLKLEDSQSQLARFSEAEESSLQELRRISQGTRAEQSEATLSEIGAPEADDISSIVESLEIQLRDSKETEAVARVMAAEAQQQLCEARNDVEALQANGLKLAESLNSKVAELEESKALVSTLREIVNNLQQEDYANSPLEMEKLRSALEAAEIKSQEDQIHRVVEVRSAQELVATLESALESAQVEISDLKATIAVRENKIQGVLNENRKNKGGIQETDLEELLIKSTVDIAELKASLMDKETALQGITEENELLKSEAARRDEANHKKYEAAMAQLELAKAAEQDALMRLRHVMEESGKSSEKAARATEQLNAARALNSEMEAELRKLRVQSDQWRKAAETAAAVLTTGSGRFVERSISMEADYNAIAGRFSPFSDDLSDDSPKRKNSNVLKKIGGLWKRGSK